MLHYISHYHPLNEVVLDGFKTDPKILDNKGLLATPDNTSQRLMDFMVFSYGTYSAEKLMKSYVDSRNESSLASYSRSVSYEAFGAEPETSIEAVSSVISTTTAPGFEDDDAFGSASSGQSGGWGSWTSSSGFSIESDNSSHGPSKGFESFDLGEFELSNDVPSFSSSSSTSSDSTWFSSPGSNLLSFGGTQVNADGVGRPSSASSNGGSSGEALAISSAGFDLPFPDFGIGEASTTSSFSFNDIPAGFEVIAASSKEPNSTSDDLGDDKKT